MLTLAAACLGGDSEAIASGVSGGTFHTCALTTEAGVKCWGSNSYGQLGDGTSVGNRTSPVDVEGLKSGVSAISAGELHTCALTTGGGVMCWGANENGQLGDGTTLDRTSPVDVEGLGSGVAAITAGALHTCALTTQGGVKCWGHILIGPLTADERERGTGTVTDSPTPVDVEGLGSGVVAVSAGTLHTCVVTKDGGVKCWGYNREGQLGNGSMTDAGEPVNVIGLASGVVSVAAGWKHNCAVTSEGGLKCWGWNDGGQLGDGTTFDSTIPIAVKGFGSDVAAVSAGRLHTCALTKSGGLMCWGLNNGGQLGDGTNERQVEPVAVSGLQGSVTAVSAGLVHTCAMTSQGGLKCWGVDSSGQLGDGSASGDHRSVPVDVVGFTGR